MAYSYLGKEQFGGLYYNNSIMPPPQKPWRPETATGINEPGDIYNYNNYSDFANWKIGASPAEPNNRLTWIKVQADDKTLYICDRVLLTNIAWSVLEAAGYVLGTTIEIDGKQYKIRLLTGGEINREGTLSTSKNGGVLPNEWDYIISNELGIPGLPEPNTEDLDGSLSTADFTSTHNKFWNWAGIYSWCQDINGSSYTVRGYHGAASWYYYSATANITRGWRPVLELVNTAPLISGQDSHLGAKSKDFTIPYTISDIDINDQLLVTESVDGVIQRNIDAIRDFQYSMKVNVADLDPGEHYAIIAVDDGNNPVVKRTYTFTKSNGAPEISDTNRELGTQNNAFSIPVTFTDPEEDPVSVKAVLNNDIVLMEESAVILGQQYNLEITHDMMAEIVQYETNTIKITASDEYNTTERIFTFVKTNVAPVISGTDEQLGLITKPFERDYMITDKEGDVVTATIKVDNIILESKEVTLGNTYTTTGFTQKIWRELRNGGHVLSIEALDSEGSWSIRKYTFIKNEQEICFTLKTSSIMETDINSKLLSITPFINGAVSGALVEGADIKIEACNNAFDENPAWEDITSHALMNKIYSFQNTEKTAEKWGINFRFTLTRYPEYDGEISIRAFGGAFE